MNLQELQLQEQDKRNRYTGVLFSALWIMTILCFVQEPLLRNSSLGVVIWVPSVAGLFLLSLRVFKRIKATDFLILFFTFAQLFVACASGRILHHKSMLLAMFRYMTLILSVLYCSYVRISKKVFDIIYICAVIGAVLFVVYTFTPIATKYEASRYYDFGYTPEYFVFNFSNPNTAAFYIMGLYCTLLINLPYRKHRPLLVLLLAACLWMIFKTECRSCFLVAIAVTVIFLFFSNSWIPNWIAIVSIIVPLLFVVAYMFFFYRAEGKEIVFLGKSLFSGREDVYSNYLNQIKTPWQILFGNFISTQLSNAHNAPLTIFTSFGIYGLACFYLVMIPIVFRIKRVQKSRITTASVACLLGLFVTSCSEAIAFLGTFPGIVFVNTFILMANFGEPLPLERRPEIVTMVKESKMLNRVKKKDGAKT